MPDDAFRAGENPEPSIRISAAAQGTLDQIADALGITVALLRQDAGAGLPHDGPTSLMEACTLLRAFVRIEDPDMRRRCLTIVEAASWEGGDA